MAADDIGEHLWTWAWEDIEFPGEDMSTTFGHDSARHQGFGQRGANVETTGPKVLTTRVRAVFSNSLRGWKGPPLFPDQWRRLTRSLNDNPEGFLTHPTRGVFTAHFDEATEAVNVKLRRGVTLDLSFTEQNGEAANIDLRSGSRRDPVSSARQSVALADATAPAAVAAVAPPLLPTLDTATAWLEDSRRSYTEASARFDALLAAIDMRLSLPASQVVTAHAYRVALEDARVAVLSYRDRYVGRSQRQHRVLEAASLARIAGDPAVYGDPSRATDLARANTVLDPSLVPAGTVLVVVD